MAQTITAVSAAALTASASVGEASVTRPAQPQHPRADSRAAPVAAMSPETTTAWHGRIYGIDLRHRERLAPKLWTFSKVCGRIPQAHPHRSRCRQPVRDRSAFCRH